MDERQRQYTGTTAEGGGYARTLRPTPVTRFAMDPIQVSWGW